MKYTVDIRWITGVGECYYIFDERGEENGNLYYVPCEITTREEAIRTFCWYLKKSFVKSKYRKWKKERKIFSLQFGVSVYRYSNKRHRGISFFSEIKKRLHKKTLSQLSNKLRNRPLKIRRREILSRRSVTITIDHSAFDGSKYDSRFLADEMGLFDFGLMIPFTRSKIKTRIRRPKRGVGSKIYKKKWNKMFSSHKKNLKSFDMPGGLAEGEELYDHNKRFRP